MKDRKRVKEETEGVREKTMKGKKKYQRTMGHFITSPKDKKAQLPIGLVVWAFFIFFTLSVHLATPPPPRCSYYPALSRWQRFLLSSLNVKGQAGDQAGN